MNKTLISFLMTSLFWGTSVTVLSGCGSDADDSDTTLIDSGTDSSETVDGGDSIDTGETTDGDDSTDVDETVDDIESWNIHTGVNSADDFSNLTFVPINLYLGLDGISIDSESNQFVVEAEINGLTSITLDGETVITVSQDEYGINITANNDAANLVEYILQGDFIQTVTFYSDESFKLSLNGVNIASSDGPAINIQSKQRAFVNLSDGTNNSLSDSSTWNDRLLADGESMDLKATIFSEGALIFAGNGLLDITAAKKHALCSDQHVRVMSGQININAKKKDAIRANNAFVMDGGELLIYTDAGKGIKVEGKENDNGGYGFITLNDGYINIETYDKAITASWEAEDDAKTTTTADDPDARVTINGGDINIVTYGIPYETSSDSLSPEGIEAKSTLVINGGNLDIQTTDDALNAGDGIEIHDGYIYASASHNDAIDSNGTLSISGGVVVANGASGVEGGMDCDNNTFKITGGLLVGIGGRNSSVTRSVTTQNTVSLRNIKSGNLIVSDSSGNVAFAYAMPNSASAVVLSSPDLQTGQRYTVTTGGTLGSYSDKFNGLYLEPTLTSNGSTVASFTISSTVTSGN